MNKRKFKGANIPVTESLTSLQMTKLKDAEVSTALTSFRRQMAGFW